MPTGAHHWLLHLVLLHLLELLSLHLSERVQVHEHHWHALEVKVDTSLWTGGMAVIVELGALVTEGPSNGDTSAVLDNTSEMDAVGICLRCVGLSA